MRAAAMLLIANIAAGVLAQDVRAAPLPQPAPPAGTMAALAALPNAPEKAIVLEYCAVCHDIDWVVRSGGTVDGWTDRIQRMIRGGATIPRDRIPAVAAYLAKAFPQRPREDEVK
jgi:cytochrome c5